MRIPAIDLIGEYHMKLTALETYFLELADLGEQYDADAYRAQREAVARSLDRLRDFRLELDVLRHKYLDPIEQALAGERPEVSLSRREAALVESSSGMYAKVWENRRRRAAG